MVRVLVRGEPPGLQGPSGIAAVQHDRVGSALPDPGTQARRNSEGLHAFCLLGQSGLRLGALGPIRSVNDTRTGPSKRGCNRSENLRFLTVPGHAPSGPSSVHALQADGSGTVAPTGTSAIEDCAGRTGKTVLVESLVSVELRRPAGSDNASRSH